MKSLRYCWLGVHLVHVMAEGSSGSHLLSACYLQTWLRSL